jgi:hypothetical protein
MGLFRALFGKRQEQWSKNELCIIYVLIASRFADKLESEGVPRDQAEQLAREIMSKQDFSGGRILQAPDGIILKVVKDFVKLVRAKAVLADVMKVGADLNRCKEMAIDEIEHRWLKLTGAPARAFPKNLDDYVYYHLRRTVTEVSKQDPEYFGFTRATVSMQTQVAKAAYTQYAGFDF